MASSGLQESEAKGGSGSTGENDGRSVHVASHADLCHLKHAERAKHHHQYNVRAVLWRDNVENDTPNTAHPFPSGKISGCNLQTPRKNKRRRISARSSAHVGSLIGNIMPVRMDTTPTQSKTEERRYNEKNSRSS